MNYSLQIPPAQPPMKTYVMESKEVPVGKCFTAERVGRRGGGGAPPTHTHTLRRRPGPGPGAQSPLCAERRADQAQDVHLQKRPLPMPPLPAPISQMNTAAAH